MPKKTATTTAPAATTGWTDEERAAHQAKVADLVGIAMKTFPTAGTAQDLAKWLKKNSAAGYKNLLRAVFTAYGI